MLKLAIILKEKLYFVVAVYFKFWANFSLRRWRPKIIAVTGSAGKTTMLNLIETQLQDQAHYSHNANSVFGIAFDIVGLTGVSGSRWRWLYLFLIMPIRSLFFKRQEPFYVVEIDGGKPQGASSIATWIRPAITLWVSLGKSHALEFDRALAKGQFATLEEAINYEFSTVPANTSELVLADGQNPTIRQIVKDLKVKSKFTAKTSLQSYKVKCDRTEFKFKSGTFVFNNPMPKNVATQLDLLILLMDYLGRPLNLDLSDYRYAPGRNSYFAGIKKTKLIDSSYNAHLISLKSILEMVDLIPDKHKWLVISDMMDAGSSEAEQHKLLATAIAKVKAERYILLGRRVKKHTFPILKKQLGDKAVCFVDIRDGLKYIEQNLKGGELLLFKGSQYLEWIIEKLLLNKQDALKLPRRDLAATKRRLKRGLN